jgi:hypothetical protein
VLTGADRDLLDPAAHRLLDGKYRLRHRGTIDVKGKGEMDTWLLEDRHGDVAPASAVAV